MADTIQLKPSARLTLQKNTGVVLYNQQFAPAAATYTSHVAQAITITTVGGAAGSVAISQGNIVNVANILLQADNACTIKVNAQAAGVPLIGTNSVWVAYSTSLTAIKVVNASTTNTVTCNYVLTN